MTSVWDNGHPPGQLLSALLDGELDGSESAAVDGHVSGCATCAEELAGLDRVRSVVRRLAFPTLAAGWEDDLIASVRAVDEDESTVIALPPIALAPPLAEDEATDPAYQGAVVAMRRRVAVTAAAVAALAAAAVLSLFATESATAPQVGRMVQSHATSSGGGDPSRLAPVAVPASFGNN
jgi:anti-sigma factor RsiW